MSILDEIKKKREKEGIKAYEPKTYIPSKQTGKVAEKSAPSLRSGVKTNTTNIPDTNLFRGLNVSKPEPKKMSGSDKDVFKRARTLAADTSMSYAERKKQIDQTQKELGRIRDKHLIASMMGNENAKKTIQQVTALQNQLSLQQKRTAFGAGFGQAAGLDIYDTAVKKAAEKTGNTFLTARMKAQDDARAQVKAANEKSYGRGELAGELTQQAILYRTAGAAAEKAVLAGMGKLIGGKALGKAGTFATRMLGQQAADTVVNTPLTIAKGVEEGKDRGEIAKDVGKQVVMDAAFNLGMGAIGAGTKAAGKALEKVKSARAQKITARTDTVLEDYGITDIYSSSNVVNGIVGKIKNTFLSTADNVRPITNEETGLAIEVWKSGIDETFRKGKYYPALSEEMKIAKIASVEQLPELIRTGTVRSPEKGNFKNPASRTSFIYLQNEMQIDGKEYLVTLDIKKLSDDSNRFYIHNIKIKEAADAQRDSILSGSPPSSGKQPTTSINSIEETAGEVKKAELDNKSKKREGYQVSDAKMPPTDGRTALELPSANTVAEITEKVNETAAKAEKINDVADAMVQNRNVLAKRMTKEERQALELEYANLQNTEYKMAQLKKIREETGGDERAVLAASNKFDARMKEIESELAAQEVLRTDVGIQMDAADEIGKIFGLTKEKEKKSINNIIQNAVKYANGGAISQKERERLFQKFYQKSRKTSVDTKKLADELRYKKILLGVDAAADIADINEWNKQLKGILGYIKTGRESNVEEIYAALHKQYPTYFPESVDDPAKQLQQMRKVAEDIAAGKELSEADIRGNFNKALDRLEEAMNVKAAYREAAAENIDGYRSNLLGRTDYGMVDAGEVQSWHNEAYRLQQAADRITTELNKTEAFALESLLNGDAAEDAIKNIPGVNAEKVMAHYNVQKPLRELQEKINGHKSFVHAQRYNYIAEAVGEIHIGDGKKGVWRDKKPFQYGRETLERNIRDIAPDEETAERINQAVAQPIHEAERLRQLFIRGYKDKLKPLKISTKKNIKIDLPEFGGKKVSESALVQWLGEHEYDLKQAMDAGAPKESYAELEASIRSVRNALTADQQNRVNAGIEALREVYKEVHPMINEVLIRNGYDPIGYIDGYFPHMNFDDPNSGFEKAASLLGYDLASKELPMDIAGRTEDFRPGKKWFGNALKREGTKTDYDALRAFDQYIDGIGDVIYHTDNIQNLRAMDDYFRYSFSSDAVKAKVDAVKATDQDFLEKQSEIAKIYEENSQNHKLQNFVTYLDTFANLLAGKKHDLDRGLEKHLLGRQVYKYANEIENKVAGNMVAGNIASAMTNFIPITQAIGSIGMKNGLRGMNEALAYLGRRGKMDELTKKSAFLTTRTNPDMLYSTLIRKVSDVMGTPMEIADTFTTQAVWRGRYYDNIGKGMSETNAIRNADEYCRGLFGGRSKGSMPTFLQSKAWKPFTMFQLEVNNQVSYLLKDIPREKQGDVKKILGAWASMAIGAYVFNDIYETLTGRRSALDPFGIANEAIGDITGTQARNIVDILGDVVGDVREDVEKGRSIQISMPKLTEKVKEKNTAQTLAGLTKNIGGNVPFVGGLLFDGGRIPLQSAIPGLENTMNAVGNLIDGGELEAPGKATLLQEAVKPAFYLLPPAGGGQMLKTAKGLNTMVKGGKYSQSKDGEKLQFAVDQESKGEWAKSLLFGQWATEGGKAYVEDRSQMLSANQTETYKKLVGAGVKNTVAFEEISKIRMESKSRDKRNAIRRSNLSEDQKATLYYDLVAEEGSKDREILDWYEGRESRGKVADCLLRMADHSGSNAKRSVLRYSSLSDGDKEYIYLQKISDTEKDQTRIAELKKAGLGMNDFLYIKNKMDQISKSGWKSTEKQNAMLQWMNEQGYSWNQQAAIASQFQFTYGGKVKWKAFS